MYNETIVSQLGNLPYLTILKKSNVTIISKKNSFGDVVKFFAQIDNNDNIQKISYKASGCSYFLVLCNYFCSLVEGKTLKNALKIKLEDFQKYTAIDDSRVHVVDIIVGTFALLVKKYRKGVEKGIITPISANLEQNSDVAKDSTEKSSKIIQDNKSKLESKQKETIKETEHDTEKTIKQANNIVELKSMIDSSKKKKEVQKIEDNNKEENVKSLSNMINKINKSSNTDDSNNNENLSSIKSGLASIHEKKMNQHVSAKTIESKNEQVDNKPKKKGLFGLFKKNK